MLSIAELQNGLYHFHGSEEVYKIYPNLVITEGVKWLCESAECFWLLDVIFSYQCHHQVKREPFQTYTLTVTVDDNGRRTGQVVCTDGNDRVLMTQELEYTSFPLASIDLWLENGVIMLPSER